VSENHTSVLIVGGGPVGLVLAIDLAMRGVPCTLVNDGETTATHPQGNTMNARTMEHYRRLGVSKAVRALGLPPDHPTDSAYMTRLNGHEYARFPMRSTEEKMRPGSPELMVTPEPLHRVSQMLVEALLKERADELPHSAMRFGWRLTGFEQNESGVTAELEEAASGKKETIGCDYLVGCDGARSTVRRALGIRYEGEAGEDITYMMGRMQSSYIEAPGVYSALRNPISFHCKIINPDFRCAFITLDGKGKFLMFTKLDPGEEVSAERAHETARAAIGVDVPVKVISTRPWTAGRALVAERYGKRRVFMAGDAIHVFTPTGGFGMNTGIDDAANLAWKLAAACQGWGGPHLLATYESERRPIGQRNTGESYRLALVDSGMPVSPHLEEDTPEGESARAKLSEYMYEKLPEMFAAEGIQLGARYDGSPLISRENEKEDPPPDSPAGYTPSAYPGGRAPHLWLKDGSALFDHFGPGFTLLRLGESRVDVSGMERAAEARGVPFKTVDVEEPEVRSLYERSLVLIRPDQHVAWRGGEPPADPGALIARVTGD
jgi:2-polyprenyl-6-methoxyphenol hydroxylase-like FAD-dependent oxidoreductase